MVVIELSESERTFLHSLVKSSIEYYQSPNYDKSEAVKTFLIATAMNIQEKLSVKDK